MATIKKLATKVVHTPDVGDGGGGGGVSQFPEDRTGEPEPQEADVPEVETEHEGTPVMTHRPPPPSDGASPPGPGGKPETATAGKQRLRKERSEEWAPGNNPPDAAVARVMHRVEGKNEHWVDRWWLRALAAEYGAVHMDFGTGDGAYVQRRARLAPTTLFIGVDASADGLREVSRRLAAKPARGGLTNALLGVLALERAPGELVGLADALTVLLPWGSLLRAVALPERPALARLHALCKPGAQLRVVFGHGDGDPLAVQALPIPDGARELASLCEGYRAAGFAVTARPIARDEVGELPTTWAKKLAFSGNQRRFVELVGRAEGS